MLKIRYYSWMRELWYPLDAKHGLRVTATFVSFGTYDLIICICILKNTGPEAQCFRFIHNSGSDWHLLTRIRAFLEDQEANDFALCVIYHLTIDLHQFWSQHCSSGPFQLFRNKILYLHDCQFEVTTDAAFRYPSTPNLNRNAFLQPFS
jgi:hypothetical protein